MHVPVTLSPRLRATPGCVPPQAGCHSGRARDLPAQLGHPVDASWPDVTQDGCLAQIFLNLSDLFQNFLVYTFPVGQELVVDDLLLGLEAQREVLLLHGGIGAQLLSAGLTPLSTCCCVTGWRVSET